MSTTYEKTSPTLIERIFAEIKEFERLCSELKDYGARDSEPDGIFQHIIDRASKGNNPTIPRDGHGWELYANSMDCTDAANKMHDQALKIVQLIEECPLRDFERLRERIKDYCWRLY